jgi:peroxiredoxin
MSRQGKIFLVIKIWVAFRLLKIKHLRDNLHPTISKTVLTMKKLNKNRMRNLLLLSLLLFQTLSTNAINGDRIIISGTMTGYPDHTRVILKNLDTQKGIDTTYILNDRFSFSVINKEPLPHGLFIGPDYDYLFFWLENVDVTIDGAKNNIRNVVINGGKIQRQNIDFNLLAKPLTMRFDSINTASKKAYEDDNIEKFKDMEKQLDIIIHDRIVLWAGYIRENPDNLISAFALSGFIPGLPKSEIKSLYENLSPEIKKSRYARSVSNFLKLSKDVNIGDIAEDFQLTDLKGNKVSLSNFKGKFVLLDFWASGCAPCRIENKILLANYKKYKGKGFEIISISSDRNKDNWASASKQDSIIWPSLIDDAHVGNRYNVKFIPSTFLIDPAGRIITTDLRGEKLGEKLKELFSE